MSESSSSSRADHFVSLFEKVEDALSDYLEAVPDDNDASHSIPALCAWVSRVRKGMRGKKTGTSVASSDSVQSEVVTSQNGIVDQQPIHHTKTQDAVEVSTDETCSNSSLENSVDVVMHELDRSIKSDEDRGNPLMSVFDDNLFDEQNGGGDSMDVPPSEQSHPNQGELVDEAQVEELPKPTRTKSKVKVETGEATDAWDVSRRAFQIAVIRHEGFEALVAHVKQTNSEELDAVVQWGYKQRRRYKAKDLLPAQIAKLDELVKRQLWSWEPLPEAQRNQPSLRHRMLEEGGTIAEVLERTSSNSPVPSRARQAASPQFGQAAAMKKAAAAAKKEAAATKKARKAATKMRSIKAHDEEWNRYYNLVKKHCPLNDRGEIWDLADDFVVDVRGEKIQLGIWLAVQKMEIGNYEVESPNWYNKLAALFEQGWSMTQRDAPAITLAVPKSEPLSDDESDLDESVATGSVHTSVNSSAASSMPPPRMMTAASARSSSPSTAVSGGTFATGLTAGTAGTLGTAGTASTDDTCATFKVTKIPPKNKEAVKNDYDHWKTPGSNSHTVPSVFAGLNQTAADSAPLPAPAPVRTSSKKATTPPTVEPEVGLKRKQSSDAPQANHKVARSAANPSPLKIKTEPGPSAPSAPSASSASRYVDTIDLSQNTDTSDSGSSSSYTSSSSSSDYSTSTSSSVRSADSQDPVVKNSFSLKDKNLFKQAGSAFAPPTAKVAPQSVADSILPPRVPNLPVTATATTSTTAKRRESPAPPAQNQRTAPTADAQKLKADASRDPRLKASPRAPHSTLPVPATVKNNVAGVMKPNSSGNTARSTSPHSSRSNTTTPRAEQHPPSVSVSPAAVEPTPTPSPAPSPRLRGPLIAEGNYVALVYSSAYSTQIEDARFALAKQIDNLPTNAPSVMRVLRLLPEHPSDLFNSRYKYVHSEHKIVESEADQLLIQDLKFLVDVPGGEFPLKLTDKSRNDLIGLCECVDVHAICYESE